MARNEANELIRELSSEAFKILERTDTPPLPAYYAKAFLEATTQRGDDEVSEIIARLGRVDFDSRDKKSADEPFNLAKNTLNEFSTSTNKIKDITKNQEAILLEELKSDEVVPFAILEELRSNYKYLASEIKKSELTILRLEEDLEKMEVEIFIDPLTKLRSEKLLDSQLEQILPAGENRNLDLYLAYIEIDDFEIIEEKYGYAVMEKILLFLSKSLQNTVRSENRIYRIDDNRFAIVFNRMEKPTVHSAVERVRSRIEVSKLVYAEQVISITVSIAVVSHNIADNLAGFKSKAAAALDSISNQAGNSVLVD